MITTKVSQTSKPGRLGLTALVDKGFVGPPHALNDLDLTLSLVGERIEICFYDMSCSLCPNDKNYKELRQYF